MDNETLDVERSIPFNRFRFCRRTFSPFWGSCVNVVPFHIDPTGAIQLFSVKPVSATYEFLQRVSELRGGQCAHND